MRQMTAVGMFCAGVASTVVLGAVGFMMGAGSQPADIREDLDSIKAEIRELRADVIEMKSGKLEATYDWVKNSNQINILRFLAGEGARSDVHPLHEQYQHFRKRIEERIPGWR